MSQQGDFDVCHVRSPRGTTLVIADGDAASGPSVETAATVAADGRSTLKVPRRIGACVSPSACGRVSIEILAASRSLSSSELAKEAGDMSKRVNGSAGRGRSLKRMLLSVTVALVAVIAEVPSAQSAGPGYLSFSFGRSSWMPTLHCQPYAGAATLEDAVSWAATQGVRMTGGVVTSYTNESSQLCSESMTYPSAQDLKRLKTLYGFVPTSQSKTYDFSLVTTAEQYFDESCASLNWFKAHGFDRAWGLFNYPSGPQTTLGTNTAASCFAFVRKYGDTISTYASTKSLPHTLKVLSVTGGACNDPALSCYTMATPNNRRYMTSGQIRSYVNPGPDAYAVVQFYRFWRGGTQRLSGLGDHWNCTGPEQSWFSTRPEVLCMGTLKALVLARSRAAVVTDPATVAAAWGRIPGGQ